MEYISAKFVGLRRLRGRAPVGTLLAGAWVGTLLYLALTRLIIDVVAVWAFGGASRSLLPLLLRHLLAALFPAAMVILFVAVVYTPTVIFVASLLDRGADLRLMLRHEYAGALSIILLVVATALPLTLLPFALFAGQGWGTNLAILPILQVLLPLPVISLLMVPASIVLFNLRPLLAAVVAVLPLGSILVLPMLLRAATFVCASPLLIILLIFLLRDRIDEFFRNSRSRESFRRNLELATLNPADASAHYNLGLLYQQRGDLSSARDSFARAVEIDRREIDAHYQLGRIAREQGSFPEALSHFQEVLAVDPAYAHHEIWREVGQVYYAAGQFQDALEMFDRFQQSRPSDAEGRYWRGLTFDRLGRPVEALAEMRECVEAVRTAPSYKYRTERRWLTLAENFIRDRAPR